MRKNRSKKSMNSIFSTYLLCKDQREDGCFLQYDQRSNIISSFLIILSRYIISLHIKQTYRISCQHITYYKKIYSFTTSGVIVNCTRELQSSTVSVSRSYLTQQSPLSALLLFFYLLFPFQKFFFKRRRVEKINCDEKALSGHACLLISSTSSLKIKMNEMNDVCRDH